MLLAGYAATVVTAVSAQNTQGIHEIHPIPPEIVSTQIAAVMEDLSPTVVKTGMLCSERYHQPHRRFSGLS